MLLTLDGGNWGLVGPHEVTRRIRLARTRGNGEGSVYLETNTGRWVAAVTVDGKRNRAIAKTEAAAKRRLREMIHNIDDGRPIGDGRMTVSTLLDEWSKKQVPSQQLSPSTVASYMWAANVLKKELGSKRLKVLRPEHVETVFTNLARHGRGENPVPMSRSSLIKIRSVLGKALDFAERRQLVSRNVARVVELPAEARRAAEGRSLTVEQANLLLAAIQGHRLEALVVIMLMLGLRPGEAMGLTWADLDLEGEVVHVRRSLKLNGSRLQLTDTLKTRRSRRSLDMPVQVAIALKGHRRIQMEERLSAGEVWSNQHNLVFTNRVGAAIDPANFRREFRRITEAAGLGRWHPYDLRHSTASLLSAACVPLEQVADVLGHDGTRTTLQVYRHSVAPSVTASRRMGDILG